MKVLKNNYESHEEEIVKEVERYPRNHICEYCDSELEYNKDDLRVGAFGCMFLNCPCCNQENLIEDEGLDLTKDNVEFPTHFHHCSKETGAVDICNNKRIKEYINEAIDYFRNNKNEFVWFVSTGNLHMTVFRWSEDECYDVIVANDHYSTFIPFENEDY